MKRLLTVTLLLLAACAAGCATVPLNAPRYGRAADPPAGRSNVYIYRIGAYPTLRAPIIRIDGRAIISPAERAYTMIPLETGAHEFVVDWAWDTGWPDLQFPVTVEEGQPLYIKISGSFENAGGYQYRAGSLVQRIPQAEAEAEITACCRYVRPSR